MFPIMCDQLACRNMAVKTVSRCWPEETCAGTTGQRVTKLSPNASSAPKTIKFATTIVSVAMGKCVGRRETSLSGIIVRVFA